MFRQGAVARYVYRVQEGGIKLARVGSEGRELVLRLAGPGTLVAEGVAYAERPVYPATATAHEQGVVEEIPLDAYRETVLASRERARAALARMAEHSFEFLDHLALIRLENARYRVCAWLLGEAGSIGPQAAVVELPATKASVASLLGLTPESFSRVLADLRAESLIEVGRQRITLLSPRRLLEPPAPAA